MRNKITCEQQRNFGENGNKNQEDAVEISEAHNEKGDLGKYDTKETD